MTGPAAEISGGFAVVGAGAWLFGPAQPAASRGTLRRRGLKGFVCPDRAALSLCEIAAPGSHVQKSEPSNGEPPAERQAAAAAWCSAANRPFLTRIDCGVPVSAVSDKVLVAPAAARSGARLVRVVPMSFARSIRVTWSAALPKRVSSDAALKLMMGYTRCPLAASASFTLWHETKWLTPLIRYSSS